MMMYDILYYIYIIKYEVRTFRIIDYFVYIIRILSWRVFKKYGERIYISKINTSIISYHIMIIYLHLIIEIDK